MLSRVASAHRLIVHCGVATVAPIFVAVMAALSVSSTVAGADASLSQRAYAILEERCATCHDGVNRNPNMLSRESLTAKRPDRSKPVLAPGDPDGSTLWSLVKTDLMPEDDPLTADEKNTLKEWIASGAEFPETDTKKPIAQPAIAIENVEIELLRAIRKHQLDLSESEIANTRYFSLHVIGMSSADDPSRIHYARAALGKTLNSLSRERSLAIPEAVDENEWVYAVDLREIGWDRDRFAKWNRLLEEYPYGRRSSDSVEAQLQESIQTQWEAAGVFESLPYVRGDWLIAEALLPKLYHDLLDIPDTLAEFERQEGFSQSDDFIRGRLIRGGVDESGVSTQPRLLDYHPARFGLWISHDFLPDATKNPERSEVRLFPLGPNFEGHPMPEKAFEQAGGEIIFTLPNGLHGYMLIDGEGGRIDAGPNELVEDSKKHAGTGTIVNGLSCIGCHRNGSIPFKDTIGPSLQERNRRVQQKIEELYDEKRVQEQLVRTRDEYEAALRPLIEPHLTRTGLSEDEWKEPITHIARWYREPLDLDQVAREVGVASGDLAAIVQALGRLRVFAQLPRQGAVKRDAWHRSARPGVDSQFQKLVREFGDVPISF